MESVFWEFDRVVHVNFLQPCAIGNAQCYSNMLVSGVHTAVHTRRLKKLSEGSVLLHNTCPHVAYLMT